MSKKITLTNAILFSLEKAIDGFVSLQDYRQHPMAYLNGRYLKQSDLSQALKRLREGGFIKEEKDEGEIIFKLTQKGKDRAILLMDESEIEWDGRWRIVIFDIPEKRRAVRVVLRKKLLDWGFRKWQRSVWASKKSCTSQLRDFIKSVGIEDWVLVIESDNIGFNTN